MSTVKNWLIGDEKNIKKNSALWNMISSILYSVQSALLLLVITRTNGLYDAGVFTIAYTMTQMMSALGSYGMRSFQVSDVNREYTFHTYFTSRIVSVAVMIVFCISYAIIQGYDKNKMIIALLLCVYRVVDNSEDVFHGEMQKEMRLDIASKIMSIRIFLASAGFTVAYVITKNLIVASATLMLMAVVISLFLNMLVKDVFKDISLKVSFEKVHKLLIVCLPLCLSNYFYTYLVNAPKYAIDRNYSEEVQSIFSILFMPIFVINMLSSFIFKPFITGMSVMWNEGQKKKFVMTVLKQAALIAALTIIIMIGCATVGIDLLGMLYGVNLSDYRWLFTLLMMFGGFAAMVAFLVVVLTIMRKQNYVIAAYSIAMLIDIVLIDKAVIAKGITGAGGMYGLAMGTIMVILIIAFIVELNKQKSTIKEMRK